MVTTASIQPVDKAIKAIDRAKARVLRLASESTTLGELMPRLPEAARAVKALYRAIHRLILFVADQDKSTRIKATLKLQSLGRIGVDAAIERMRTTPDATLRIMLIKALAAILAANPAGVVIALHEIAGKYDDSAHQEALKEAWPMLIKNLGEYRRSRLEAEQAAKRRPRSGAVRGKQVPATNQVIELARDRARECDQTGVVAATTA
jgi:hypothetical protein